MKKICIPLYGLLLALCSSACSAQKNVTNGDALIYSQTEPPSDDSNASSNEISEPIMQENDVSEPKPLSEAIKSAIIETNKGKYSPGECCGVGYKVMETFEEDGILSVYALTTYLEYGFEDNVFVNISGTNSKNLMRFRLTADQGYELCFYTRLDVYSGLSEEELETLVQPLKDSGKQYLFTDQDLQEIRKQADEEASEYLKSINRTADVGERQSHEGKRIEEIVLNEDLLYKLLKDIELSFYPDWLGTTEKVENGERYIYQTDFDRERQEITYTKTDYKTGAVVNKIAVDILNGTVTHLNEAASR